jgi:hypothetical protein
MGKCKITIKELRFVIEKEMTHAYYLFEAKGDCPSNIQGWHHKAFFPDMSILDIINTSGTDDPMSWPLEAPEK